MKVVVLGGTGNFGARICRALAREPGIALVVAARDLSRAQSLASELGASAVRLDTQAPGFGERLQALAPQLLIHTAGPFQGQDPTVARCAAAAQCHYIDLADGRRFVCDFAAALNEPFRAVGRTAVTGASTVPALSSAVVDHLRQRFERLEEIEFCIAPAQRAPRGPATIAGVLSYCGRPVRVWEKGRWCERTGWADPQVVRFARLRPRHGALCDIPDLELFPARYAGVSTVVFRAALEVVPTQYAFAGLARLGRLGLPVQSPAIAFALHHAGRLLDPLGTSDGGMVVRLRGTAREGTPLQLAWNILAPNHRGPEIPCMAAILLARRLARGEELPIGAMPCMGLLRLQEFEPEFRRWDMQVDLLEEDVRGA
ncbi:MAG TPA: saccharopine dehydrogenase NADP-binding domain-containing protein [Ramlibacter sp.]